MPHPFPLSPVEIERFCRRWRIREFALFGSAARGEAGPGSDYDVLVVFDAGARWSLLDHATMEAELEGLCGRSVDLVTRSSVERSENAERRRRILADARTLYAA